MLDWPTWILASLRGPFAFVPVEMASYRQHPGGIWNQLSSIRKGEAIARLFEALLPFLPKAHRRKVRERLSFILVNLGRRHAELGDARAAWRQLGRSALYGFALIPKVGFLKLLHLHIATRWLIIKASAFKK